MVPFDLLQYLRHLEDERSVARQYLQKQLAANPLAELEREDAELRVARLARALNASQQLPVDLQLLAHSSANANASASSQVLRSQLTDADADATDAKAASPASSPSPIAKSVTISAASTNAEERNGTSQARVRARSTSPPKFRAHSAVCFLCFFVLSILLLICAYYCIQIVNITLT